MEVKTRKGKDITESRAEMRDEISNNIKLWEEDQAVSRFFRKRLGAKFTGSKKMTADMLFDSAATKAIQEERPEWTKLLFDYAAKGEDKSGNSQNVQVNIGSFLDNLEK